MKTFSVFCLLLSTITPGRFEPQCSKYDYDERTLTKIITVQLEFQQFLKQFELLKEEVTTERKHIEKEKESMKEEMTSVLQQSSMTLKTIEDRVKAMGDELVKNLSDSTTAMELSRAQSEATISRMSADIREVQNESIRNLTSSLSTPDVRFTAQYIKGSYTSNTKELFVFDQVDESVAGGYDKTKGTYTVPVAGQYLFTVQLCNYSNRYVYFALTVDGVLKRKAVVSRYSGNTCSMITLISHVNTGSRVAVMSTSTSKAYCESSNYGCYFTGYLLKHTPNN